MENVKRVMVAMPVKQYQWLKETAKTLDLHFKDLLAGILERAMNGDTVKQYKQDALRRQLDSITMEIEEKQKAKENLKVELETASK